MNEKEVCCVIVTYNIGNKLLECYNSIINQVDKIVFVDNASDEDTQQVLKYIKENDSDKVKVIYNKSNMGIAYALNQGIKYALEKKCKWILTLDHDSICENGYIEKMLNTYEKLNNSRIGIITPRIFDKNIKQFLVDTESDYKKIQSTFQSGCLISKEVFEDVGYFNEELFIYYVDEEFFDRVIKKKYDIVIIKSCILYHEEGNKEYKRIFFWKTHYNNYSAISNYYIVRNSIYMIKYDMKKYFYTCIKRLIGVFGKTILYDKHRFTKLKFIMYGLIDGIKGKYGEINKN